MTRRAAVVALIAATALALGVLLGTTLVRRPSFVVPTDTSVDAGFARDMQAHHGQAVELARMVRDRTDDDDVRTLALDILLTQQNQAGQMTGWLETWQLPQSSGQEPMAWAGEHAHGTESDDPDAATGFAAMPGWVGPQDLARLTDAEGTDAERIFLELMIPHHQGGVEMAEAAVDDAEAPQVRRLAESIIQSQSSEITVLEQMLEERGGPPT